MNFGNYNIERTRAPRRRTPGWIYGGAIILAGLVVWGVIKLIPERPDAPDTGEAPGVEAEPASETVPPAPAPAPVTAPAPVPKPAEPIAPPVTTPPQVSPKPDPVSAPTAAPSSANAPSGAAQASAPASSSLADARNAQASGDYVKARELALAVWNNPALAALKPEAEKILNEVGIALVLSPREMPGKIEYTVQPGDSLDKIAKKFGTTIDLIRTSNNIRGSMIRAGDRLRILEGKFSVKVSKSRNDLELYLNDQFFKRYAVGTGEFNKTPVGDFVINDRIAQPTWWRPDGKSIPYGHPENLLGTHWLSINVKGYGLHGTWEPETIGHQASAGCVRMLNSDIEQLFTLLPLGTPVSIRD